MWLKEGDQNTNFFHNSVKARRSLNKIYSITSQGGKILEDPEEINKEAIEYFSNFPKEMKLQDEAVEEVLSIIPNCILASQNNMLMGLVLTEEVKVTLFSMGDKKAPRSDGFPAYFIRNIGISLLMIFEKWWRIPDWGSIC